MNDLYFVKEKNWNWFYMNIIVLFLIIFENNDLNISVINIRNRDLIICQLIETW